METISGGMKTSKMSDKVFLLAKLIVCPASSLLSILHTHTRIKHIFECSVFFNTKLKNFLG